MLPPLLLLLSPFASAWDKRLRPTFRAMEGVYDKNEDKRTHSPPPINIMTPPSFSAVKDEEKSKYL